MKGFKRILWLFIAMALVVALGFGCAPTRKAAPPAKAEAKVDWKFHDIVDVNFVKQHVKIPKPENVVIIDSRPKRKKYDKGYICTAINIPDSKFDKMTDRLPKDKNALLIFYCEGPT